jgi:hypothetical protein
LHCIALHCHCIAIAVPACPIIYPIIMQYLSVVWRDRFFTVLFNVGIAASHF